MQKSSQESSKRCKKWPFILIIVGIIVGIILYYATSVVFHKTSETKFCISCHTMQQPFAEYQGSKHFQNSKGVRAQCSDCHIPKDNIGYLSAKFGGLNDVWGEITGKIDTPEKYETNKLNMAQSVWKTLKDNNSSTCRSCHSFGAMDILSQDKEAQKSHPTAILKGKTCIECHKGVAHILPNMSSLSAGEANKLASEATNIPTNAKKLYTIQIQPFWLSSKQSKHNDGNLLPSTEVKVLKRKNDMLLVEVVGWQQDGIKAALYAAQGKRILSVIIGDKASKNIKILETFKDKETNQIWHKATLQIWLPAKNLITDQQKIWNYASELMANNCSGCHALTALNRFKANEWIGVIKGMAGRTSLSQEQVRILTQYVQKHASDMTQTASSKEK